MQNSYYTPQLCEQIEICNTSGSLKPLGFQVYIDSMIFQGLFEWERIAEQWMIIKIPAKNWVIQKKWTWHNNCKRNWAVHAKTWIMITYRTTHSTRLT